MPLTPTTRLGLVTIDPNPTTGDFVDPTVINANMAKIDAAIGGSIATSGARPSSPFDGQLIRETDTRRVMVRNNTQGVWDPVTGAFFGTAASKPASPSDGMLYRETDTRRFVVWNATSGAWESLNGAFPCLSTARPAVVFDGMLIRETDTRRVYVWNNTQGAWDLVRLEWSRVTSGIDANLRSTTSSTFNNGGNNVGVTFTAPPSGAVCIEFRNEIAGVTGTSVALTSFELRTGSTIGSGTVVVAPASNYGIRNDNSIWFSCGMSEPVGGLTANAQYNVRLMHASTNNSATCQFANRRISVTPDL